MCVLWAVWWISLHLTALIGVLWYVGWQLSLRLDTYVVAAYGPQLAARLHLSHTQMNVVGLSGNGTVNVALTCCDPY